MIELDKLLEEYKALTIEMINETENTEKLVSLLNKRQEKIESINQINFNKKDFMEIANKLNLLELEKQLKNNVEKEKLETKKKLTNVKRLRQARKSYIKRDGTPSFLDKST